MTILNYCNNMVLMCSKNTTSNTNTVVYDAEEEHSDVILLGENYLDACMVIQH